jgi:type II restriction/modification system DNA methylase subunit YeeA
MPVNTAALKTFAPAMRRQLLEAVGRKLDLLLNSQTPDTLSTYAKQIAELREQEAENHEQLLERVAYTWFNRLSALRYLDARGWHPFGCKVLMPAAEGETQPELLKLMRAGSLPAELKPLTNEARLHGLLDGQIPPAISGADPQGEVYRELVLASCRSYHQLLPELFEGLDDVSELLLPDDLLSEGSIAGGFRCAISDTDCEDVEIIGWLYQFYISEKKDQVIGKVVKSEDIPAATQLFTPNWIVKYLVQNSLGATWLATYPDSPLKGQMEFYIEPAEQTPEVQSQLAAITPVSLDPETLTLIDPACGSGHILAEAYELFKAFYAEHGHQAREIPRLILERNIFGMDIDKRAAQLAAFSLLMKGRADDRRLLEKGVKVNVTALVDSTELDVISLENAIELADYGLNRSDLNELKLVFDNTTTFGSLIKVPGKLAQKLPSLKRLSQASASDIFLPEAIALLDSLVRQAELLSLRYDVVVANPPYMGSGSMNPILKEYVRQCYSETKGNLFACFMERCWLLTKNAGRSALITMQNWMFLPLFEAMRKRILGNKVLTSMAHLGPRAFGSISGEVVSTTAFSTINIEASGYHPAFHRLVEGNEESKARLLRSKKRRFDGISQTEFSAIPGSPIAYWSSAKIRQAFASSSLLDTLAHPAVGLQTGDNDRFLRLWQEVSFSRVAMGIANAEEAKESGLKWIPHSKGGPFRKWFGNSFYVVNWEDGGRELMAFRPHSVIRNPHRYFQPCLSWTVMSGGGPCFRFTPAGNIIGHKGPGVFAREDQLRRLHLFLNSKVTSSLLEMLSEAVGIESGQLCSLPIVHPGRDVAWVDLISLFRLDWNTYERSWDFLSSPLLSASRKTSPTIESSYASWIDQNLVAIAKAKHLEEENNCVFIDAYDLQEELCPDVPIEQITLTVNPAYRYGGDLNQVEQWERFRRDTMAEFLSYATGCMMGRYSLDQPGLILADSRDSQAEQLAAYEEKVGMPLSEVQFKPDPDGIIPVLDGEWFEDDIVARTREFLAVTFPESSVAENLRFIEESLGKEIRKYFCSEFYKDHLQTYKKRPIYWMVQSPKKGFACLVCLHRYTKDTLNQVLNNYFRPYLQKLEARLAQLGLDQLNDSLPTRERTAARKEAEKITKVLKECQAWEQDALLPLAQQRIPLDLDDGVKANYLKLQDVLAPIPGLAAKED